MNELQTKIVNEYKYRFVGRDEAIDTFYSLKSLREQKNVLYLEAEGGIGKTRLIEEFISVCRKDIRPWHVGPSENPIIDFYNYENRSVAGLRRSIANKVGDEYFPNFYAKEQDLSQTDPENKTRILALQAEVEQLFFHELRIALQKIPSYTALFFDTFEVVFNRQVGYWFLHTFLEHPVTRGCNIVFAGRPRDFYKPFKLKQHDLKSFDDSESEEYFAENYGIVDAGNREEAVIVLSAGHPLMMDLLIHYTETLKAPIFEAQGKSLSELEPIIISRFLEPIGNVLYEVIRDMAYLKRRYDRAIYEWCRNGYSESPEYDELYDTLCKLPFIKYRDDEKTLALHDKFQEMFEAHGRAVFNNLKNELFDNVVLGWYHDTIQNTPIGTKQNLLRTEQLVYIWEKEEAEGKLYEAVNIYNNYFKDIKANNRFDFNDLLWGEISQHLVLNDKLAYELSQQQANWLFDMGHNVEAIPIFKRLLSGAFDSFYDENNWKRDTNRLGHCYLRNGESLEARDIWEQGIKSAKSHGWPKAQALLEYNLGHALLQEDWNKAELQYKLALRHARVEKDMALVSEALYTIARLLARKGSVSESLSYLEHGLKLMDAAAPRTLEQGQIFAAAGDVYRYVKDVETAQAFYKKALELLMELNIWLNGQARAYSGLGASYVLGAESKRSKLKDFQGAIADQIEAIKYLTLSLDMVREHNLYGEYAHIFDHLADVFIESHWLRQSINDSRFNELQEAMSKIQIVEEESFHHSLREKEKTFEDLDLLGKAQRLFELAFLHAERMRNYHQVMDSLIRAATVAQVRNRKADIEYYATLADLLHGLDDQEQEDIFESLLSVLRAHFLFDENVDYAIENYQRELASLADKGGFGWALATYQLSEVERNLLKLEQNTRLKYCENLANAWQNYSDLARFAESIQDITLSDYLTST